MLKAISFTFSSQIITTNIGKRPKEVFSLWLFDVSAFILEQSIKRN